MDTLLVYKTLAIGLITYVIYKLVAAYIKFSKFKKPLDQAPGPTEWHWLYGNAAPLLAKSGQQRIGILLNFGKQFSRLFRLWTSPFKAVLFLHHPDTLKILFKSTEPKNRGFGGGYRHALPWLGEGLLIAGGQRWARSRRLLTPAFHFDILHPYINIYNDSAELMLNEISKHADSGKPFELFEVVSSCTLDIILKCAFSYETGCQQDGKRHPYVEAVTELSKIIDIRTRNVLLHPNFVFYLTSMGKTFKKHCDYVHSVAKEVIDSRKNKLKEAKSPTKKYLDFLDILLTARDENGVGLTDLEIRNEVDTFLFEGHDTTASGISWILYALASHPEFQRKCQEEIDAILEDKADEKIEWEDLPKFEYLTQCIKEGMRINPPVPAVARALSKEMTIDGITYLPGTMVALNMYLLHHNPTVWKNPEIYDPERFSKENIDKIGPFDFCPFAAGPRNCIGQNFAMNEEKVLLARFLHRYTIELDPTHVTEKAFALVLRAPNGIKVIVKKRKQ